MTTKTRLVSPSAGARALCMGRARLDAEPDGRRPSDGCALLGVVHASYQVLNLGGRRASARRPARDHRGHHRPCGGAVLARPLCGVQIVFLILVLYYSFSRTECPCPKTYTGRKFDNSLVRVSISFPLRVRALWVRFRAIKQDPGRSGRRREARETGRASAMCRAPSGRPSSTRAWPSCTGAARDPRSPMFVDKSDVKKRPLEPALPGGAPVLP